MRSLKTLHAAAQQPYKKTLLSWNLPLRALWPAWPSSVRTVYLPPIGASVHCHPEVSPVTQEAGCLPGETCTHQKDISHQKEQFFKSVICTMGLMTSPRFIAKSK